MSHDQCRDRLGEYLDQTLPDSERAEVTAHLGSCAACAQIARELAGIRATLRAATPVPAPPQLRANVRAALQKEAAARAKPPFLIKPPLFAWKMPAMAWSGTLVFATFALLILARPFANAPLTAPETDDGPPASFAPARAPRTSPQTKAQPKPTSKTAATKQVAPLKPSSPVEVAPSTRKRDSLDANSGQFAAPATVGARPPQRQRATPEDSATRENSAPPRPNAARPAARPNAGIISRVSPPASIAHNPSPASSFFPPTESAPAPAKATDASPSPNAPAPAGKRSAPRFSLQLKAAPAPEPASSSDSGAAPAIITPVSPQADALRQDGKSEARKSAAEAEIAPAPPANALASNATNRAMRTSPAQPAPKSVGAAPGVAPGAASEVRRFELRFQGSQAFDHAQIRLQLPPKLRLLWPLSNPIWSGNLRSDTPLVLSFSLGAARGGETITVVVEQKPAGAPSRVLETQTLTLPAF